MRHLSGQLSSDCDFRPAMFTKGVKFDSEGCKNRESQRGNKEEGRKLGNFCWVSKRVKTRNEFKGQGKVFVGKVVTICFAMVLCHRTGQVEPLKSDTYFCLKVHFKVSNLLNLAKYFRRRIFSVVDQRLGPNWPARDQLRQQLASAAFLPSNNQSWQN